MQIAVANLTLRFYKQDGWTKRKVAFYLVDKKHEVTYRESLLFPELDYFAVYNNSGHKVFKKSLLKHEFDNRFHNDINWYIK